MSSPAKSHSICVSVLLVSDQISVQGALCYMRLSHCVIKNVDRTEREVLHLGKQPSEPLSCNFDISRSYVYCLPQNFCHVGHPDDALRCECMIYQHTLLCHRPL